jgi:hypothetical protein
VASNTVVDSREIYPHFGFPEFQLEFTNVKPLVGNAWRSYFDTVSVKGQRGDKISRLRADSLVQVASLHFKATPRWLAVGAVLFNRNADDFREQRLDDQTGVWVMRRYCGKRTTLTANELFPSIS